MANNILQDTTIISSGTNYSTVLYDISNHAGFCIHAIIIGNIIGTLSLEGSIDGVNWFTLKVSMAALEGSDLSIPYNIQDAFYLMARVSLVVESGSGTVKYLQSTKERS